MVKIPVASPNLKGLIKAIRSFLEGPGWKTTDWKSPEGFLIQTVAKPGHLTLLRVVSMFVPGTWSHGLGMRHHFWDPQFWLRASTGVDQSWPRAWSREIQVAATPLVMTTQTVCSHCNVYIPPRVAVGGINPEERTTGMEVSYEDNPGLKRSLWESLAWKWCLKSLDQ